MNTKTLHFTNLFIFISIFFQFITQSFSQSYIPSFHHSSSILYSQHCSQIIPESTQTHPYFSPHFPSFYSAYVINGDQFLGPNSQITANLIPQNVFKTSSNGIFKFQALLGIRINWSRFTTGRYLLNVHGGPRFRANKRNMRFQLSGYWDSSSGQLCMVGSGTKRQINGKDLKLDVIFKSVYPNSTVINNSLITGTLESLNSVGSDTYFKPISIMSFAKANYEYSLIKKEISGGDVGSFDFDNNSSSSVSVGKRFGNCYQFANLEEYFELGYKKDCDDRNCSWIDGVFGFMPRFMSLNEIDCSEQMMVRVSFSFSNVSDVRNGYRQRLDPSRALVAEGAWNAEKNQLLFVACRIVNFTKEPLSASIDDCSIRVNFTVADTLTIRDSSVISGHVWSVKSKDEPDYFDRIEIRASGSRRAALPDMKYKYTVIDKAKKFCAEKVYIKEKGKNYPEPYSQDMKFDMEVRNSKGNRAWGKAYPVFVGDRFVQNIYPYMQSRLIPNQNSAVNDSVHGSVNVAYRLTFFPKDEFKVGGRSFAMNETIRISAEGIYDTETGRLCMVGCWNLENDGSAPLNASTLDCDTSVKLQFPPRDSSVKVKGTIESKRENSDRLYFDHLDVSSTSLTTIQVTKAFWRMDFEITLVLISNTLACIFVGLQLFHVKRNPNALPFISVIMLVVITLGHMIPLLLNMEAFFLSSPSKRTVLFGSGGWLEVNEVLVRVITMVVFLLEFRLLQLTLSARGDDDSSKNLWECEKKVLCYTLPLYVVGALIAWIIQLLRGSPVTTYQHYSVKSNPSLPFWNDMKSYAGFILDAFLLPQIMFNVFSDSKERALAVPYYIGTTVVRLLPHAYDVFRSHSSSWNFDPWYIYADPRMNFYSTTWDILVSCLGLCFVALIFLQQWLGGRWVLPKRFSKIVEYEKVPIGL
ncbi:uncharacterized protein LOC130815912 [Amaranthus tricolor]|uniref:uncharacterized protein LOC130815912 n=1 Tax=Amaranthus tricolor TaxID=29722 RepID=UPI0025909701|nr:uncharacterized protein LOC130815912 [Amaranthus tricolor]